MATLETMEELIKRFKEERIAREKARIQMLHDLNRQKYNKDEQISPKYFKPNRSLNKSNDKSPIQSAINKSRVKNYMHQKKRVKNYFHVNGSYGERFLNYSAPGERFLSVLEDSTPRRKSTHDTAQSDLNITRDGHPSA